MPVPVTMPHLRHLDDDTHDIPFARSIELDAVHQLLRWRLGCAFGDHFCRAGLPLHTEPARTTDDDDPRRASRVDPRRSRLVVLTYACGCRLIDDDGRCAQRREHDEENGNHEKPLYIGSPSLTAATWRRVWSGSRPLVTIPLQSTVLRPRIVALSRALGLPYWRRQAPRRHS